MKSIYGSFQYWNPLRSSECILLLRQDLFKLRKSLSLTLNLQQKKGREYVSCVPPDQSILRNLDPMLAVQFLAVFLSVVSFRECVYELIEIHSTRWHLIKNCMDKSVSELLVTCVSLQMHILCIYTIIFSNILHFTRSAWILSFHIGRLTCTALCPYFIFGAQVEHDAKAWEIRRL